MTDETNEEPSIFGRERALMEALARAVHKTVHMRGASTDLREEHRGYSFQVQIEVDGEPTGHVATITLTMDRWKDPS